MTFSEFQALCTKRKSAHSLVYAPIEKKDILDLIAVAHLAPSVANTQPWHFHIVCDVTMLSRLIESTWYGNDLLSGGALIVVTCNTKAKAHYKNNEILWDPIQMQYSCAVAMEHIVLGATAKRIGNSWVSLHNGPVHTVLNLSKDEIVVGGILLGNAKEDQNTAEVLHDRVDISETYTFH